MAQVTALSPLATPGLPYSFVAKTEAVGVVWTSAGYPYREWLFTDANWGDKTFYVEAMMKAVVGTAYLRLYNTTDGGEVTDSEVTTASASRVRVRSGAFEITAGHDGDELRIQFGSEAGDSGEGDNGELMQI